jgi:hypothetical protein
VAATFDGLTELATGPSIVSADVKLPSWRTVVMLLSKAVDTPVDAFSHKPLLDLHRVAIATEPPTRRRIDVASVPMFDPTTVTLWLPVTAAFAMVNVDAVGPLYVTVRVNVRDGTSNVTPMRRECHVPIATLAVTADDDCHVVDSSPLPPTRSRMLDAGLATLWPTTVTLVAPVAARFVAKVELGSTTSKVTTDVTVSTCSPDVIETNRVGDMPIETRPRSALVDTHIVDANVVPPTRPAPL